jgi:hypothetical protein
MTRYGEMPSATVHLPKARHFGEPPVLHLSAYTGHAGHR